jgi:Fe-S cluster biogenesis protein NfuA
MDAVEKNAETPAAEGNVTLRDRIERVLNDHVRPRLQMDGGDVELVDVSDDGVVKVRLTGGCEGCPMAGLTMTMSVERLLKQMLPEIARVEPTD